MKALFIILPIVLLVGFIFWAFIAFKPNENGKSNIVQGIIASILALISLSVLIIVPGSIHQVNAGEVAVVKIWGDAREVRSAGIYFDGWLSHKYEIYDCKVQQIPISTSAYSSDSQPMDIELYVQYQIQQENAMKIATNYGGLDMLEGRIQTVSIERMKAVLSKYKAEELIKARNTISPEVEQSVKDAITTDYFVNITTVVLTNIDFSDAFEKSVEDKMIAEQEKLKETFEHMPKDTSAYKRFRAETFLKQYMKYFLVCHVFSPSLVFLCDVLNSSVMDRSLSLQRSISFQRLVHPACVHGTS